MIKLAISMILLNVTLFGAGSDIFTKSLHGNFCGKETPRLHAKTDEEEIKKLQAIVPIDVIDKACQRHDICYLEKGIGHEACDDELVLSLKSVKKKFPEKSCRLLAKSIIYFFEFKNSNPVTVIDEDYSVNDKLKEMPSVTAENMFYMGSFATDLAVNFFYSKPTDYVFDSKNNSQRRKEVFQFFPPRYKACTY